MAPRRRTHFDDRGLIVDGSHLPFYAGAMHYWRMNPSEWKPCLRSLRSLGLRLVDTYVPWRVHKDFTGPRDLSRFLAEAADADLRVVLRPGPTVNAELTAFGLPDHVLAPPFHALTSRNTPAWFPAPPRAFPIPSYASRAFHDEVRAWYATVAKHVLPHISSIAAISVDNETQHFFRLGAFDLDYHPDAIAWWRELDDVDPPRDASSPHAAAWIRFKDHYTARALSLFSSYLDDVGLDAAHVHNLPPTDPTLYDLPSTAAAIDGIAGIDAYSPRSAFASLRRRALHCAGSSPLPLALEAGVGFTPFLPPITDPDHDRDQLLTLLAAGIRGFNLYMAVERDRFYGAAIDRTGKVNAPWIAPLLATLDAVDWPSLRRRANLALVLSRADVRHGTATTSPLTPVVLDALGLSDLATDAGALSHRRWFTALESALSGLAYDIVDENADLSRYTALIVPTHDRIDSSLLSRLRTSKATLVLGPGTPTRDELDRPISPLPKHGRIRPGSLDDLPSLTSDLSSLAGDPEIYIERPADVHASTFVDASNTPRVIFVQSFVDKPVTATLVAPTPLRDPFSPSPIDPFRLALSPRGIRMLIH